MSSSRSLLLADSVLAVLESGDPVTARKVARLLGEDVFRVSAELTSLAARGVLRSKTVRSLSRPNDRHYVVFTPVKAEVRNLIDARKGLLN